MRCRQVKQDRRSFAPIISDGLSSRNRERLPQNSHCGTITAVYAIELQVQVRQFSAMQQSFGLVAFVVRDYDEAIDFFVGALGFELVEDSLVPNQAKRWVVVAPPGSSESRLLLARASTDEQLARIGSQTGGRVFLFLHTDDFWRDYDLYRARGVQFVREPKKEPYGTVAVFKDLYGNLWDLLQPASSNKSVKAPRNCNNQRGAMSHPWLEIPIADYEAHMALPSVGQAQLLRTTLQRTVVEFQPRSLAVLGVAGGNGLEFVERHLVRRVVALDFNPDYLAVCCQRYASSFTEFEPVLHDLSRGPPVITPVECIFAGLVLEYLPVEMFCDYLATILTPHGRFAALLQLPSPTQPELSPSPFNSLTRLQSAFSFVDPAFLDDQLSAHGFTRVVRDRYDLHSGKSFCFAIYQTTKAPN
jgi:catechol 2,3-dioxygenase-like lactoylglutathione lyase family enzyme